MPNRREDSTEPAVQMPHDACHVARKNSTVVWPWGNPPVVGGRLRTVQSFTGDHEPHMSHALECAMSYHVRHHGRKSVVG